MSITRYTEVKCNGPDCDRAWTWSGNADDVRERARDDGWLVCRPGGLDFCSTTCRDNAKETQ
jgi:hypothetical protein